MFQIKDTLVSEALLEEAFCCDLQKCKGACCVEGEAGAPLDEEEVRQLEKHQEELLPFLEAKGRAAIAQQGAAIQTPTGDWETPLVGGKECVYATFDEHGQAHCGIEQAHRAGATSVQKPISCHLYPVRTQAYSEFTAVNYHQWSICSPACQLGAALKLPVYQFTKKALIRKFGQSWFDELDLIAKNYRK